MAATWRQAHERLLQILPVREHRRVEEAEPRTDFNGHRTKVARDHRRRVIRQWLSEGATKEAMAARLQVTVRAVEYHLAAIAEESSDG
jgi:hypothetical protein